MTLRFRNQGLRRVRVGDIKENPKNYRTHGDDQREAFETTLDEIGFYGYPDVFATADGELMLVDGELRTQHLIAHYGEDTTIEVNVTDFDESEADKALATKDPLAAMAGINAERYRDLLNELEAGEREQNFSDLIGDLAKREKIALEELLENEPVDAAAEIDRAAELGQKWQCERGALWRVGLHRLACGDATNGDDVARVLGGVVPGIMITDPPYGVEYDPGWRREYDGLSRGRERALDNDHQAGWQAAYELFPGRVVYLWHGDRSGLGIDVGLELRAAGFEIRAAIVWKKQMHVFGRGHYHWQHESCWYAVRRGMTSGWCGDRTQSTIWEIATVNRTAGVTDDGVTDHGTQKPVECMLRPLRNHEFSCVYDPFLGSGTTMVAAEQLGRRCYGLEIDPAYCGVILERMTNLGCDIERLHSG